MRGGSQHAGRCARERSGGRRRPAEDLKRSAGVFGGDEGVRRGTRCVERCRGWTRAGQHRQLVSSAQGAGALIDERGAELGLRARACLLHVCPRRHVQHRMGKWQTCLQHSQQQRNKQRHAAEELACACSANLWKCGHEDFLVRRFSLPRSCEVNRIKVSYCESPAGVDGECTTAGATLAEDGRRPDPVLAAVCVAAR